MASTAYSQSLIDAAGISESGDLNYLNVVRLLKAIEARFKPLEAQSGSLDAAIEAIRKVGLDRINEVLVPAIQLILDIQSKGFMIAASSTPATMVTGDVLTFVIDDEGQRALFTPSDFVALTRASTPDDYAVLRTVAYTASTGQYIGQVIAYEGSAGPHSNWVLGALAGSTMASVMAMSRVMAARADAVAAAAVAVPAAVTATAKAGVATDAAAQAVAAAQAAAAFDPSAYYTKSATYSKSQADTKFATEADARATAIGDEAIARSSADAALSTAIGGRVAKLTWVAKSANFAAVAGNAYVIAGAITATFPAAPAEEDTIGFLGEAAETTPYTLNLNGKNFEGATTDITVAKPFLVLFAYRLGAWPTDTALCSRSRIRNFSS